MQKRKITITSHNRFLARERTGGACGYCSVAMVFDSVLSPEQATLEHINPTIRGGDNSPENLLYICRTCNSTKQGKTLEEYRIYLGWSEIIENLGFNVTQIQWLIENTNILDSVTPKAVVFEFERCGR